MSELRPPIQSTKALVKALVIALALACVVFVTLVLPAEYNIDPTGVGGKLGLTVFATPAPDTSSSDLSSEGNREDLVTITVPANSGLEYKFRVQQHDVLDYEWDSGDSDLYFDLHGEPEGDATGYFKSFAEATGNEMKGSVNAPFTGSHGWYWRNRTAQEVVVTLTTSGRYQIIGLK